MTTEMRWLASVSTSCLHAAEGLCRGRMPADAGFAEAITPAAVGLAKAIRAAGLPAARFWRNLVPLSAGIENNRQLTELSLRKTIGPGARTQAATPQIASWITELETAGLRAAPKMLDQLELRGQPLRQQWEARGPGMLRRMGQLTDEGLIVSLAQVVLVHPTFGGGGAAHLPFNSVRIEGVLANPQASLPEVVRLAWMIAQLNIDLPRYSESILADRQPRIAALAMLPVALSAAEYVELARCDAGTIALALSTWDIPRPKRKPRSGQSAGEPPSRELADAGSVGHGEAFGHGEASAGAFTADGQSPDGNLFSEVEDIAATLADWWSTYIDSRPAWSTALAALDRMVG